MNELDLQKFNQAIQLAQNGQNMQAQNILAELILRYPKDANIWLWTAFTSPSQERARRAVERAAKLEPTNPNLAHARAWLEQHFTATTAMLVQQATNPKAMQSSTNAVMPAKVRRPASLVRTFIVLLVLGLVASTLLLVFVPEVRGFVAQNNFGLFSNNNAVPAPSSDLVTRLPAQENALREMLLSADVPTKQTAKTKSEDFKFGLFTLKTKNTSKILAYYAEKYPPKVATFTSFNTPKGAILFQELPDTKENLLVFIFHNDQSLQDKMQTQFQMALQPDESVMVVLITKEALSSSPESK